MVENYLPKCLPGQCSLRNGFGLVHSKTICWEKNNCTQNSSEREWQKVRTCFSPRCSYCLKIPQIRLEWLPVVTALISSKTIFITTALLHTAAMSWSSHCFSLTVHYCKSCLDSAMQTNILSIILQDSCNSTWGCSKHSCLACIISPFPMQPSPSCREMRFQVPALKLQPGSKSSRILFGLCIVTPLLIQVEQTFSSQMLFVPSLYILG